jgi:serine/threonine-protein kinase
MLDSGEWDDHWVIVMPRADESLRHRLSVVGGGVLPLEDAVSVLRDVVEALVDIADRVVHRDIKPENTLFFGGHWCLADFGIARYAEASTAPDTHKFALTPAYAAPERWRAEHATPACDVYAFGVMAFEMLGGRLPFVGPTVEDFRHQHLNEQPPPLAGASPSLASLVTECLYKAPEARPSAANLAARLAGVLRPAVGAAARLQEANRLAVERAAAEGARISAARSDAERRKALVADARKSLQALSETLRQAVLEAAPSARPEAGSRSIEWAIALNEAVLAFGPMEPTPTNPWGPWKPAFEVAAHCEVGIRIPRDRSDYEGRSHSLWYCDAQAPNGFRWFETAFMITPIVPRRGIRDPFALDPGEQAGTALSPGIAEFQVAWPFTAVDQGDDADFLEHWIDWFARAALGELSHPPGMPERRPDGSWRR